MAADESKIDFKLEISVDILGLDGSTIAVWKGPGTTPLGALRRWLAEKQDLSVLQVRLVCEQEVLSGDFEEMQTLLGHCSILSLTKLAAVPATYQCGKCAWQLAGFTCAKCEELLLGEEDGGASCPQCEGKLQAPRCCENAMRLLTKSEGRGSLAACATLPAAERRETVDSKLCPAFTCSACSFGVTGVRCLTCKVLTGRELERNGFFERAWGCYIWTCPNGCCRPGCGGAFGDVSMCCARCPESEFQCSEYYEAFGPPHG